MGEAHHTQRYLAEMMRITAKAKRGFLTTQVTQFSDRPDSALPKLFRDAIENRLGKRASSHYDGRNHRSRSPEYAIKLAEGVKRNQFAVQFKVGRSLLMFMDCMIFNYNYLTRILHKLTRALASLLIDIKDFVRSGV